MSKLKNAVNTALVKGPQHNVNKAVDQVDMENLEKNLKQKNWDDVKKIHSDLIIMLANNSAAFQSLVGIAENDLPDFITADENTEVGVLARGYCRDLENISVDLLKVHSSHEKRMGKTTDETDFMNTVSVIEAYLSLHEKALSLLAPVSARMVEIVGTAADRKQSGQTPDQFVSVSPDIIPDGEQNG